MSALSELSHDIEVFWHLPHHNDATLKNKLNEVQSWQKNRMCETHRDLFNRPTNQPMADYFLNNLYASDSLDEIIRQLERILPKAKKIENLSPATALETGILGIQTAIKSIKLDLALAKWLLDNNLDINVENMHKAYQTIDSADERRQQIEDLRQVCYRSDKYLKSYLLQKAFKLTKNQAKKHDLTTLYNFIDSGFTAMKPLKSVSKFIDPFCERELQIIEEVHSDI